MKKLYTKNIIIMMALFLTLSLNAQNKTEYMSYFASDSTTANVCINSIDNIHTCIFNFHKDNIMTINGKEYYVATVYQWKFGYETTSASYYNNEYNILLREETETGRLYRYDMEGEKEILVCDMSLEIGDVIQFYLDNKDIQDITVDKISYTESGKKEIGFITSYGTICDIVFTEGCFPNENPFGLPQEHSVYSAEQTLICEYFDGEEIYHNNYYNDCYVDFSDIEEKDMYSTEVYPNPGNNILNIKTPLQNARIEVFDILGKTIFKQDITEEITKISTENWTNGMYLWKTYNEGKEVNSGKWLKQ